MTEKQVENHQVKHEETVGDLDELQPGQTSYQGSEWRVDDQDRSQCPGKEPGQILDSSGAAITGTDFSGQLFGGPNGGSLNPVTVKGAGSAAVYPFYGAARAGFLNTGFVTVVVPGVDPNTSADVQLRVWENNGGALTDWSAADGVALQQGMSDVVVKANLGLERK